MLPEFKPDLSPEDKLRLIEGLRKSVVAYPEAVADLVAETRKQEGIEQLVSLFEQRLRRSLSETERQTLEARFDSRGAHRLREAALDLKADELVAWLADPNAG